LRVSKRRKRREEKRRAEKKKKEKKRKETKRDESKRKGLQCIDAVRRERKIALLIYQFGVVT